MGFRESSGGQCSRGRAVYSEELSPGLEGVAGLRRLMTEVRVMALACFVSRLLPGAVSGYVLRRGAGTEDPWADCGESLVTAGICAAGAGAGCVTPRRRGL